MKSLGTLWYVPDRKRPVGTTTGADGDLLAVVIAESESWTEVREKLLYPSTEQTAVIDAYEAVEARVPFSAIRERVRVE